MGSSSVVPMGLGVLESSPSTEILGYCFNGRKVVYRAHDRVYVKFPNSRRMSGGAPACSYSEWLDGFRPPRMGKLVDAYNPFPTWDDSERLEVVEGGGWPFWDGADGDPIDVYVGSYAPKHALVSA